VPAQRALTRKVEVLLEVRHRKLAQRPVDGLAKAQPCEFAGGDRAPEAMPPKDRDHVILVADRRQIHDQGRVALDAQRRGRQHRAFDAIRGSIRQDSPRRSEGLAVGLRVVRKIVQEPLDLRRRVQLPAKDRQLRRPQLSECAGHGRLWQNL